MSFRVVPSLCLASSAAAPVKPKLQGASPPSHPPRPPVFGDICFRATANVVDAATSAPYMTITGYLPSPTVTDVVQKACARVAKGSQRCTEPALCVMRRNDALKCEGVYYEFERAA